MFRSLLALVLGALTLGLAACTAEEPFEPRRATRGRYTVVWLAGTPYEIGYQHGELLRQELAEGFAELDTNLLLKGMFVLAQDLGLIDLARESSYPEMVEECRGLVDGAGSAGWTMDHCLLLNCGDVINEFLRYGRPKAEDLTPGCTQFAASGPATADGRLYHARVLDWHQIDFVVRHPVVFVRRPAGGVPHVVVGFPGNLSPYQGINAEGIAVASNEVNPRDSTVNDSTGRSHVQLLGQILAKARSLADVREMVRSTNHMSLELLVASDGETGEAEIFEMAPQHVEQIPMQDGLAYATNHFQGSTTAPLDGDGPEEVDPRFLRLEQLLLPDGPESLFGSLSPEIGVQIMRDRTNAITGEVSPQVFDDGLSIATNGALYQLVFDPAALSFWVAAGALPVTAEPFTGFSLGELLDLDGHDGSTPQPIP